MCSAANELQEEVQRLFARLEDLLRRQRSAVAHAHENTLAVLDREIVRVKGEKKRVATLLEQHRNEHGCD